MSIESGGNSPAKRELSIAEKEQIEQSFRGKKLHPDYKDYLAGRMGTFEEMKNLGMGFRLVEWGRFTLSYTNYFSFMGKNAPGHSTERDDYILELSDKEAVAAMDELANDLNKLIEPIFEDEAERLKPALQHPEVMRAIKTFLDKALTLANQSRE